MKKEILILFVVVIAAAILYFTVLKEDTSSSNSEGSQMSLSEGDEKFIAAVRGWYHGWVKTAYPNDLPDAKIKHAVWQIWVSAAIKENVVNIKQQYDIAITKYDALANYALNLKSYII